MDDCYHCRDFSRSEALRAAIAEAGRGLPAIEPGMPLPAGTGLTRRSFVARSAGMLLAVYGASRLPLRAFEDGIAEAAVNAPNAPVLVTIFLQGGADALNVLFPAGDPLYAQLRPTLKLDSSGAKAVREDGRLFWHPSLGGLSQLYDEGKVSLLPSVGYTHPDQSHFTSRHFWEVGATQASLTTGWLGRFLDATGTPNNPLQGLTLDTRLSPVLASSKVPVAAIDATDRYTFGAYGVSDSAVNNRMIETIGQLAIPVPSTDPALGQASDVVRQSAELRAQLQTFNNGGTFVVPSSYPATGDFAKRLAGIASMLSAGMPLKCIALTAPGGYDTHALQATALGTGLQQTSDTLLAFQRDLEQRGVADRVLTLVWSEFGRRARENGSAGTDHGAAGTGFLIGTRAPGTMIGEYAGLQGGLDTQGNLVPTADFRGVYASLLEQWFGFDATQTIPDAATFQRVKVVR
ncbi:MAG: DUF1501 domain-containing protein [Gaiellaceae bacterium]